MANLLARDDALDVDGHDVVPVRFGYLHHGAAPGDAHVVVQDVQPAVALDTGRHHAFAIAGVGNVGLYRGRRAAFGLNQRQRFRGPLLGHIGQQDFGALPGEQGGGGPTVADAGAAGTGAGYDCYFSFQSGAAFRHDANLRHSAMGREIIHKLAPV